MRSVLDILNKQTALAQLLKRRSDLIWPFFFDLPCLTMNTGAHNAVL